MAKRFEAFDDEAYNGGRPQRFEAAHVDEIQEVLQKLGAKELERRDFCQWPPNPKGPSTPPKKVFWGGFAGLNPFSGGTPFWGWLPPHEVVFLKG